MIHCLLPLIHAFCENTETTFFIPKVQNEIVSLEKMKHQAPRIWKPDKWTCPKSLFSQKEKMGEKIFFSFSELTGWCVVTTGQVEWKNVSYALIHSSFFIKKNLGQDCQHSRPWWSFSMKVDDISDINIKTPWPKVLKKCHFEATCHKNLLIIE